MKIWTYFLAAVLCVIVGHNLNANDDREGNKREQPRGNHTKRDNPHQVDRDHHHDRNGHRKNIEQQHHEGKELEHWVRQQQNKAHELLKSGRKDEAHKLMQQVEEAIAKHQNARNRHQHGENKNRNERIHHIHQAIQHLKAAGLDDWAGELMKQIHGRHHGDLGTSW